MSDSEFGNSDAAPVSPKRIRLQRYLASCGLGSRRACEDFITTGRVTVDGKVVSELGAQIDPQVNKIALDGEKLKMERKKYYVFNKPPGVLCTNRDPEGRPRVIDFFPKDGPRVFTVGRLDEDSEGLLIVTNDGDLAQKLAHPSYRIFRTYHVLVAGSPTPETLTELRKGIYFEEGRFRVEGVKSMKRQGQSTWCEVVLAEGHNREVRRLFSRVGHKVMKLQRVAFGPIFLGRMLRGEIREIRRDELERLFGMLVRNEDARTEAQGKRPRTGAAKGKSPKRNDGDLLNRSSRKAPPERRGATASPSRGPQRPPRPGAGPVRSTPKTSRSVEPRGLGVEDVSDEQMMGLTSRSTRSESRRPSEKRPAAKSASPRGPKSSGGARSAAGPKSTAGPKGATGPKNTGAAGKRPQRPEGPKESFGRRSPGQPKAKGARRNPRGR